MDSYLAVDHILAGLHVDVYVLGPQTYTFICDRYSLQPKIPMDILESKYLQTSPRLEASGFQGCLLTFFTYF